MWPMELIGLGLSIRDFLVKCRPERACLSGKASRVWSDRVCDRDLKRSCAEVRLLWEVGLWRGVVWLVQQGLSAWSRDAEGELTG